jgi:hypothetical protein
MKSPVLGIVTAALLGLVAVGGALAADLPRAHFGGEPTEPDDFRILARFSRCVVNRQANRARAILADTRAENYRRDLRRFAEANWGCAPRGELKYNAAIFASGMAETLLASGFRPGDLAAHVAVDSARPPIAAHDENEVMSLCTVRAAPAEVAALLQTEVASPQEAAALRAIVPSVTSCLRAGTNLSLNRHFLRSILALAAYRLSDYNGWARVDTAGAAH